MKTDKNKSIVFGEYLRNVIYGRIGVIESPKETAKGLEMYEAYYFEKMSWR
ncbi:hypothetical protein [Shouchella patagoniensis]|uniref:hypothetical protein n=1 Tax=Shouchella patagoniensis TaxID=228576 RepID=UPI0014759225|nr:hypothetical protein [Shouchella patagoniensis]